MTVSGWQVQGVDARRDGLDAGPEQPGQGARDRVDTGKVQRRLPLAQVVDDQIADRLAPQRISVDEFFDGQPSGGESERADGVWGVVGKDAQRTQPQVEIDLLLPPADMHSPLGVDQFHAVADGDIRDPAALAGQQRRDPGRGHTRVRGGAGRLVRGELPQPREPVAIPDLRHRSGQIPVRAGQHPRHIRSDDIAADQHQQPGRQILRVVGHALPAVTQPSQRQLRPGRTRMALGRR